jgi:uncharacterized protein
MRSLLKVLVGSRAHGVADASSDWDYRSIFQHPTALLVGIQSPPDNVAWVEGEPSQGPKIDATGWELGHFLKLAVRSNPTILEVFVAPVKESSPLGEHLRALFPYVWDAKAVMDSFIGYGKNQRTKFLTDKETRPAKYATAYLRVLYQAEVLLSTGQMPINMAGTPIFDTLMRWRLGDFTRGEVIDTCYTMEESVKVAYESCRHKPNIKVVENMLLEAREEYFFEPDN